MMSWTQSPRKERRVTLTWTQWQEAVLSRLRIEYSELLESIGLEDVDWESWRPLYNDGRTPQAAIDRALERDF
ncbi:MAG TPA: hypothetical protein VHB68_02290 [Steroidobacteraceae bacterium]|nr:hypothetical protein [Steroidobacteraceae bacterium]